MGIAGSLGSGVASSSLGFETCLPVLSASRSENQGLNSPGVPVVPSSPSLHLCASTLASGHVPGLGDQRRGLWRNTGFRCGFLQSRGVLHDAGPPCKPKRKIRPAKAATFLSSLFLFPPVSGCHTHLARPCVGCRSPCPSRAQVNQHRQIRSCAMRVTSLNPTAGVNPCNAATSPCNKGFKPRSRPSLSGRALFQPFCHGIRYEPLSLTEPYLRSPRLAACVGRCGGWKPLVRSCSRSGVFFHQFSILIHAAFALGQIIDAGWRHLPLSPCTNLSRIRLCLALKITHGPFRPFPGAALPVSTVSKPCALLPHRDDPLMRSMSFKFRLHSCVAWNEHGISPYSHAHACPLRPLQSFLLQHSCRAPDRSFPMHSAVFQQQWVRDLPVGVILLPYLCSTFFL
jgi:hypothetical protein